VPSKVQLSVVIPTKDRDEALARCLALLAPQIDETVEVIVSDDARSIRTQEMIHSRFAFATWIPGPQRGPAANRNHGASQATGEFLVFLDDDVEPAAELISSYRTSILDDVNVYEGRTTCRAGVHSPLDHAPANETGGSLWSCNMMLRRSLWKSTGGFDEDFRFPHLEDVALRESLKALGERVLFVRNASVDHPPRRLPPPGRLALYHEAQFVYEYKYLGRAPSIFVFLPYFFRHRLRTVLRYPVNTDSVIAVRNMFVESFHILAHWREWDRRWSPAKRAAGAT
jgi:glycosyltransferase involved in cell wall biosynthesis